jgi:hypothetical protein
LTRKSLTGQVAPKFNRASRLRGEKSTPGPGSDAPLESPGLAGNLVERAMEVAREAHDGQVMANLRAELDELMKRPGAHILTRGNALALLAALSENVTSATNAPIGMVGTDQMLVRPHHAMALLDELIDALHDLDSGKTHSALKPASYAANASLTTRERKWDDELLNAVTIVQSAKRFKTRKEAEEFLAENLNAAGKTRRGKPYTRKTLKRLRDDLIKRK